MRARDTSASGSRFMNSLTTQLHVPPENARTLAEALVGGKFACPLGGEYVLVDPGLAASAAAERAKRRRTPRPRRASLQRPGDRKLWASTATPPRKPLPPHRHPRRLPDAADELVPRPLRRRRPRERRASRSTPTSTWSTSKSARPKTPKPAAASNSPTSATSSAARTRRKTNSETRLGRGERFQNLRSRVRRSLLNQLIIVAVVNPIQNQTKPSALSFASTR